jgi:preprotein translocase subunit SecA
MVSKAIANAQKKVEGHNFDIRKQLLQYDNVVNDQRQAIYTQRKELLLAEDVSHMVANMRQEVVVQVIRGHIPPNSLHEQWDIAGLEKDLLADFGVHLPIAQWLEQDENLEDEGVANRVLEEIEAAYTRKRALTDAKLFNHYERMVLLQTLDNYWREHLANMDHLRHSIGLRGYAQKDPKQEYKRESFNLFQEMWQAFQYAVVSTISKVEVKSPEEVAKVEDQWRHAVSQVKPEHQTLDAVGNEVAPSKEPAQAMPRVGRNDPCPCGSGQKFKHCHGALS